MKISLLSESLFSETPPRTCQLLICEREGPFYNNSNHRRKPEGVRKEQIQ